MKVLSWLLTRSLPDPIKRLIFLSSLAAYIRDLDQPDIETLKKINEIMCLSGNAEALKFPMKIHTRIWGNFDTERLSCDGINCRSLKNFRLVGLPRSQMRIIANRLIDYMPVWLKYKSREAIRQDIYMLFLGLDSVLDKESKVA